MKLLAFRADDIVAAYRLVTLPVLQCSALLESHVKTRNLILFKYGINITPSRCESVVIA
jgi:hypothetical protein